MKYSQIRSMDISNGEGVGVALFVQGCHFHCNNCFNSETWDFNGGKEWTDETEEEFLELVNKPYIQRVSILGVLVDGRYIHELRDVNLKFRGSSNQRIIDVKKSLESGDVILWDI